ncbi:MAG: hypothetical protein Q4D22_03145 [Candidatus Saccharibacteria bacterium]|nr:hypothetical protein [Candidatus Saccharibacteria bacterium]
MKIKKSRKRAWMRFLVRVGIYMIMAGIMAIFIRVDRIVGDERAPFFKDGDLVFTNKIDNTTPFLLVRVRGFDD